MNRAAGPGGTLLPERYIATTALDDARTFLVHNGVPASGLDHTASRVNRWWERVAQTCGPATPIRAIFDLVAMPWLGMSGFRCHDAVFEGGVCRARLDAGHQTTVALLVTCWAAHRPTRWVDLARHAREIGARWGILIAPPFLSIVALHGFATRRSIDMRWPDVLETRWLPFTATITAASAFADTTGIGMVGSPRDSRTKAGSQCLLDHLVACAGAFQDGVRNDLQRGVETALAALHPVICVVGRRLRPTDTSDDDEPGGRVPSDEALTLVYRLLFLLFAESRHLSPIETPVYQAAYAVGRFCREAIGGSSTGLWTSVAAASRLSRIGCRAEDLRVSPFNGALFAREGAPNLEAAVTRSTRLVASQCDEAMQVTLAALGSRHGQSGVEPIAYHDLGVEQLGAVYERVLDLRQDDTDATVTRATPSRQRPGRARHSSARRRSGTFYTPQPLADLVVRQTLTPLVSGRTAERILDLRVVDPAMGSGAFLVAACRFLAAAYEEALVAEGRLSPEDVDEHERACMRRLIAERCLAGVDSNPMAVQLARLSLWLTTLARDRPLSFLDHRLRAGDSLVGAWPGDLWRLGRAYSDRHTPLLDDEALDEAMHSAAKPLRQLLEGPSVTVAHVHAKEASWRRLTSHRSPLHRWRLALHLWCARWFLPHPPDPRETRALIDALVHDDRTLDPAHIDARLTAAAALAAGRRFFHWSVEFPDVFDRTAPGFDAVIGNPPWEMVRRDDGTADNVRPLVSFVRESGLYPSCTHGHLNLYQAFVDRALSLVRRGGRIGLVLPWGIAVDEGAAPLRERLWREAGVETITGIDNAKGIFPIHRGVRIVCLTASRGGPTDAPRAVFGIATTNELDTLPARPDRAHYPVTLARTELARLTGPSLRIPDLRHPLDARLLAELGARFARLGDPDGWHVSFSRELNATSIRTRLGPAGIPIVEGKHLAPFVVDHGSSSHLPQATAHRLLPVERWMHPRLGYRDVSAVGNRFTLIAAVIPAGTITTHTVFCVRQALAPERQHFLCALLNSFVINHAVRLLMGSHVTTALAESLPVPVWQGDAADRRIACLARRLATHLHARPASKRHGATDEDATHIRARLQALVARRFGIDAPMLAHVLDATPGLSAADRAATLEAFDEASFADNRAR